MSRRRFIVALAALGLACPARALAQPAGKPFKVVWFQLDLDGDPSGAGKRNAGLLRDALTARGWVDGVNISIEDRSTVGSRDVGAEVVADILRRKVDVLVVRTALELSVIKKATTTVPVVFLSVSDPVGLGYVQTLARPGGNITGLSYLGIETNVKRLEILTQLVPAARRIGVAAHAGHRSLPRTLDELRPAAKRLNVELHVVEFKTVDDFDGAFAAMARSGAKAVLVLQSPLLGPHRVRLATLLLKHRLPAIVEISSLAEAGVLMSYGPDVGELHSRSAYFVDRILKGAKPADLPVEQSTKLRLVLNRKTATALGLTIPAELLLRADQVID
jgi:putative ABC transport system substrate-binding protein